MMASVALTHAADYQYLVFKSADGTSTSLNAVGLTITFKDGTLVADDGSATATYPLSTLASMSFSNTSGIAPVSVGDGPVWVFTLTGSCSGQFSSVEQARKHLQPGVYVIKSKDQTRKMTVK